VALIAWSSEQLLPGYPLLEARLKATTPGLAPFVTDKGPDSHFLRALGWFRAAGFTGVRALTLAWDAQAPLGAAERRALELLLGMRWPGVETELEEEDRAEYERLCHPGSPDFVLEHPDHYAFFTYTMFWGQVAQVKA
jgi:demethylmenaquinone methyltransferase/2-methoxy-6-polyprenyl-1,4-benzoquinol methylase